MRRYLSAALILLLLAAYDVSRPPEQQIGVRAALAGLTLYQATLSRVYAHLGIVCRFEPTCSHYAVSCLRSHGLIRGAALAVRRVLRCGPWTALGTLDPPPVRAVDP